MRWTHLRNADLNLLLALHLLVEERQVKRAADRYGLSQPAMSRVLQRLRDTFGDELLIRTRDGYEPTPRALRLHLELREILPRIEIMLHGDTFDPLEAVDRFSVACSDYSTFIQGPALSHLIRKRAPNISLDIVSLTDQTFLDAERGKTDLILWVNTVPAPLVAAPLFVEEYVCVVANDHSAPDGPMTLQEYLGHSHIEVAILQGRQPVLDTVFNRLGIRRDVKLKVPYFATAIDAASRTDLIATVPKRIALPDAASGKVRLLPAPEEIGPIEYLMAWHPRLTDDPSHSWLRDVVAESASGL